MDWQHAAERFDRSFGHPLPDWWRPVLEVCGQPTVKLYLEPLTAYRRVIDPADLAPYRRSFLPMPDARVDAFAEGVPQLLPVLHLLGNSFVIHEAWLCWDLDQGEAWSVGKRGPERQPGDIADVLLARLRRASRIHLEDERRNRRGNLGRPDHFSQAIDAAADRLELAVRRP